MRAADNLQRPRKRKTNKAKPKISAEQRAISYVIGAGFFLLGIGLLFWFSRLDRAPGKIFNLLAAGGVGSLLSGIGLFLHPLDEQRLDAFQNDPNPISVFRLMPVFWKVWMLIILAAMIGAFIYVAQNTVRVGG